METRLLDVDFGAVDYITYVYILSFDKYHIVAEFHFITILFVI